jgi:hypothetical protein
MTAGRLRRHRRRAPRLVTVPRWWLGVLCALGPAGFAGGWFASEVGEAGRPRGVHAAGSRVGGGSALAGQGSGTESRPAGAEAAPGGAKVRTALARSRGGRPSGGGAAPGDARGETALAGGGRPFGGGAAPGDARGETALAGGGRPSGGGAAISAHAGGPPRAQAPGAPGGGGATPALDGGTSAAVVVRARRDPPRGRWGVQVAAHPTVEEARAFVAAHGRALRALGPVYVLEREIDGTTWFRVRVGGFSSRARAEAGRRRLPDELGAGAMIARYR